MSPSAGCGHAIALALGGNVPTPVLADAVEKVRGMPAARNNRIIGANF
jgi:hypothetical protein